MEQRTGRLNGILNAAANTADGPQSTEVTRLQRALLQMAFAVRGSSPELDRVLARLSNAARGTNRDIDVAPLLDEIVTIVTRPEADGERLSLNAAATRRNCGIFLDTLKCPGNGSLTTLIGETRARLQGVREESQMLALIRETAQRFEEQFACGRDDSGGTEASRHLLLELINQITFSAELDPQARELRAALSQPQTRAGTDRMVQAVGSLLKRTQAQAREEVERLSGFLRQVVAKVETLQKQVLTANSSRHESARMNEALSASVSGHMEGIQSSIQSADTLDGLKESVSENLKHISDDVDSFVEQERERNAQTEELFATLTAQLQALDGETQKLREGIVQERTRATTDPLTGVANRLAFDARLAHEFDYLQQQGGLLSVIVVDIDRFKSVNDTFGHQTGDKVLKTVAEQLRTRIRQSDFLARFGGEEFVVLLPGTPLDMGCLVAEKLRGHIESCKFHSKDQQVPVTISLGVAGFAANDTPEQVFERADQALYLAKHSGRNRVCSELDLNCAVRAGTSA